MSRFPEREFLSPCLATLALVVATPVPALGQAGSLDPTFGVDGKVVTDFQGPAHDTAQAVILRQSDGKIVAAGSSTPSGASQGANFALARYNTDGSLDPTFGVNGQVLADYGGQETVEDAAFDAQGRILVVGMTDYVTTGTNRRHFVAARFSAEGALDTSFGGDGWVDVGFGDYAVCTAVAFDSAQNIVLAGHSNGITNNFRDVAVARLLPNGDLDLGFGGDGKSTASFWNYNDVTKGAVIDTADGIVLSGQFSAKYALCRFNASGQLDTAFGGAGGVAACPPFGNGYANDIIIQSTPGGDRIIAAGYTYQSTSSSYVAALAAYTPSGELDTTFGVDGAATVSFGLGYSRAEAITLDSQNRPVIAGQAAGDFGLARFTADGLVDTALNGTGAVKTDLGSGNDQALGIAVDSADRPIVGGFAQGAKSADFALVRYDANGVLDVTFDADGVVLTDFLGSTYERPTDVVALQADGKILVVGYQSSSMVVVRYNEDGSLDSGFGVGGSVTPEDPIGTHLGPAARVMIDGLGRILVALDARDQVERTPRMAVVRLLADGTLDATFDGDGIAIADIAGAPYQTARGLEMDANGRIFIGGMVNFSTTSPPQYEFGLACLLPSGAPDLSFGAGGGITVDFDGRNDWCEAIAIQSDGKIVMTGYSGLYVPSGSRFAVARCHTDGQLDTGFGTGGRVLTSVAGYQYCWSGSIAIGTAGRIVIGGDVYGGPIDDFAVLRYRPDGSLDPAFGGDGIVITDFAGSWDGIMDLVLDAGGGITAVGWADTGPPTNSDFAIARYHPNGSLDPSFGNGGLVNTDFGSINWGEQANAITVDGRGRLVVVGQLRYVASGGDIGIARYQGVASPPVLVEWLVEDVVEELVVTELLNNGEGNSLQKKLQAAIQQIDKGHTVAALNQLEAFIAELEAKVNGGSLSTEEAQPLIDSATYIINLLTATP